MDHTNHGSSMDHDMPMHDMCKMNMIFTWDWKNTCIIYDWWHVKTVQGFLGTVLALVMLSMFYEFLRSYIARWKSKCTPVLAVPSSPSSASSRARSAYRTKLSIFYAIQVGFSFMLMLVFMTYNGWYMLSVVVGAGLGYFFWGDEREAMSMSCH